MSTSESSILGNFLLPPAPLNAALPFRKFASLFPRSHQGSAQIKALYDELQYLRAIDVDDVKHNIKFEVKRGEKQKREVIKERRRAEKGELDQDAVDAREMNLESQV